jgi:Putative transposase/Transposase zinc-binding domain
MGMPSLRTARARHAERWEVGDIARRYGPTYRCSSEHRRVVQALAQCRTAALGGHLEQCAACGTTRPVYNSCRNRHCPKCESLAQAAWRDAQQALLLPIPYFHLVFTLPHELNVLIRTNPRRCYAILFQAVAATLKTFAHDPRHLGAELGVTAVLHTWSQTLVDHVHLHCIVTGGGLGLDGTRWRRSKGRRYLFPVAAMAALFRGKFLARLIAAYRRGALVCAGPSATLADPLAWQQLLTQLRAKAWYVYAKAPFAGPKQVLNYLARYTHRIAISNERILGVADDQVRFRYKDYAAGSVMKELRVDASEFLRRFLLHVVPRGFMRVRHYGLLANRHRAARLARCREVLGVDAPPAAPMTPPSIADRILQLTGIDILRCPVCGQGPMRRTERLTPDTS